ncbi:MAG: MFS transporter [Anaerolineales bacterium]|nr:MFS transporter [Anaerolineales bacterium]
MKKWGVLILMSLSMFIIVIDTTIMNVSISALVADLNTTISGIQSAIALYALVMASFMLIGGKLADIVGKKRIFVVGLVIFGIGTTTASLSHSLTVLLIGWSVLEGIGSALMMPNIQTILRSEYAGPARATAYGVVSAVAAAGAAIGPIVGGFLTTYASWRWAFRLEVLIVIVVLLLSGRITQDILAENRPKFDFLGAVLSIIGWASIVLGILLGQEYGFWLAKKPFMLGGVPIAPFGLSIVPFLIGWGALVILLLFRWEARQEAKRADGLFRPSLLGLEGLTAGFAVRFVHMAIMAAFLFLLPLLLQLTFEYTAMQTGLALIPYSLSVLIFALLGARLSARLPAKRLIQIGFGLGIAGLFIMTTTIPTAAKATDLASGALFGAGMGLVASQILNLILSSGSAEETAEIAGLNGTFEQLGNSIGVALVGTIMLMTLSAGMQQAIDASSALGPEEKTAVNAAVEESIELVSDSQLESALTAVGVDPAAQQALGETYARERTQAFQAGMMFLVFVALGGFIMTTGLSSRKLVEAPQEKSADAEVVGV